MAFCLQAPLAVASWKELPRQTLGTRFGITSPSLGLELKAEDKAVVPVRYQPRAPSRSFVGLSYAAFGVSFGTNNKLSEDDKRLYGESRANDAQFRFYGRRLTWDFFFQDYEGYYIENTPDFDSTRSKNDPRLQRPDLRSTHYGFQTFYNFDPKDYHLGSNYDHSVEITASGASRFGLLSASRHVIKANSSLVPASASTNFGDLASFSGGEFHTLRLGFGYGGALSAAGFYLSGLFSLGVGLQQQKYELTTGPQSRVVTGNGFNLKAGLGYNGKRFSSGFQVVVDNNSMAIGGGQLGASTTESMLFFGMRLFDIPLRPLDALSDWIFGK